MGTKKKTENIDKAAKNVKRSMYTGIFTVFASIATTAVLIITGFTAGVAFAYGTLVFLLGTAISIFLGRNAIKNVGDEITGERHKRAA